MSQSQLHWCWHWHPLVRDKGRYYSQHSRQRELHILTASSWAPSPMGVVPRWAQAGAMHTVDSCESWGTVSLENLRSYSGLLANLPNLCSRDRHYLYYPCQKTNLPPAPERDSISILQGFFVYNILGKTVWDKSCYNACRNDTENYPPSHNK